MLLSGLSLADAVHSDLGNFMLCCGIERNHSHYGLHSAHGFLPVRIASSRVLYRTRFLSEILAADLQPALWKTAEFFDAT
jgi:hypothetical protein